MNVFDNAGWLNKPQTIFLANYRKAQQLDPEVKIAAESWETLCYFGNLFQQAEKVSAACERAVTLAFDEDKYMYRAIRGLARALTGNIKGAIEDFQFFVEQTKSEEYKAQWQGWIEALKKGEKPFTEEVLKELREK